jgi:hypothetical protein
VLTRCWRILSSWHAQLAQPSSSSSRRWLRERQARASFPFFPNLIVFASTFHACHFRAIAMKYLCHPLGLTEPRLLVEIGGCKTCLLGSARLDCGLPPPLAPPLPDYLRKASEVWRHMRKLQRCILCVILRVCGEKTRSDTKSLESVPSVQTAAGVACYAAYLPRLKGER